MRINIKNTPERLELVKAMVDSDPIKSMQAKVALADFIAPVVQQVLNLASLAPMLYTDLQFNEDDNPEIPLDMFYGTNVDQVTVWQQSMAGGTGSSLVTGLQTLKLHTYELDSAVSLTERNIRRGRLPVISLALNRMAQELLAKQERNAFYVVLRALGEASTNGNKHCVGSTTANVLQLDDFNRLITRSKRINVAFNTGTPDKMYSNGATDLIMSPEMTEQIRGFAYQPMNTRAGSLTTSGATSVPLPDNVREGIYKAGGESEIYGITLHEALEFGVSAAYNNLFGAYQVGQVAGGNSGNFATGTDEVILGWDATRGAIIRPVQTFDDNGGTVKVEVDDSWTKRSGKVGWWSQLIEGRVVIDSRALTGLIV